MWFDGQRQTSTIYVASVSRGKDSTAMLEAIKLMGWPLDMIVSVDIWFDEDTPAELPPMVAFKDAWDAKCLEHFGVPVTRLCAQKREREREQTQESITHERPTDPTSTGKEEKTGSLKEQPLDSRCREGAGAKNSNMNRLTYKDIFYRPMKPKPSAERERETAARTPDIRFPDCRGKLVQLDAQDSGSTGFHSHQSEHGAKSSKPSIYGFPYTGVKAGMGWCHELKQDTITRSFPPSPGTRGRKQISFTTSALPLTSRNA